MKELIKTDDQPSTNANIPQQAAFFAQRYYNKRGMGKRVVISADFVDGGIMAEYEGGDDEDKQPEVVASTEEPQEKLKCTNCGKEYTDTKIGQAFFNKHIEKCNG